MSPIKKFIFEGKAYYSVGATARILSTTPNKVREMMGRGDLEWRQFVATDVYLSLPRALLAAQSASKMEHFGWLFLCKKLAIRLGGVGASRHR